VTKRLDPARDDSGVRLRTARLRRGMTQTVLADLACISPAFVSMVETGERELTRVCDLVALADVLRVSPLYLADGREGTPAAGRRPPRPAPTPPRWPATSNSPASSSSTPKQMAAPPGTGCAAWPANPPCTPWLLLDQLATILPKEMTHQ
jgi:transcriptional regulator with XRE-family HTH domain